MPRLPGRESTQTKVPLERLEVAGFMMPHESRFWAWKCVVPGCDHKMGPSIEDIKAGWEACSTTSLPAFVIDKRKGYDGSTETLLACPCCVDKILA